jgi:hypothetical protein
MAFVFIGGIYTRTADPDIRIGRFYKSFARTG